MSKKAKNGKVKLSKNTKNDQISQHSNENNIKHFSAFFDESNILILQELLKNNDITSTEISNKLKIPLSTIQRRKSAIEKSGFLQKKYEIDPKRFGLRSADILINVSKGDCEEIARAIINQYRKNVLEVTIRIGNPDIKIIAKVIYKDSDEAFDIMHNIRRMEHVEHVEWSEIVKTVLKNESSITEILF